MSDERQGKKRLDGEEERERERAGDCKETKESYIVHRHS
jgi:hypothetical protein